MSVMTPTATADIFGIADGFATLFRRFSQTTVNVEVVSRDVGRVIAHWDDLLVQESSDTTAEDAPFPNEPVDAVDHVARLLRLPHERVIAAVQIAPRTYYGWKTEGRRARPQSLGRLWPMTEAIHFMARAHSNLAAWFSSSAEAQTLFDAGDVDGLVQLELDWALRTYPTRSSVAADFGDTGGPARHVDDVGDVGDPTTGPERHTKTPVRLRTDEVVEVTLTRRATERS
jgi:uncharacterized protein (DUF2384 family)